MINSPHFIKQDEILFKDIFEKTPFIEIALPLLNNDHHRNYHEIVNHIIKAFVLKYPEYKKLIPHIRGKKLNIDHFKLDELNFSSSIFIALQEIIKNIHIVFINYEKNCDITRKNINSLIRTGCICRNGKLLFHISSNKTYQEFIDEGYSFETHCDKEKLLLFHEIIPIDKRYLM